jgi:hypothetical protein
MGFAPIFGSVMLLVYFCVIGFGFWLAWQGVMALKGIQGGIDEISQTLRRMETRQAGS